VAQGKFVFDFAIIPVKQYRGLSNGNNISKN